jgi:hypothetical protein
MNKKVQYSKSYFERTWLGSEIGRNHSKQACRGYLAQNECSKVWGCHIENNPDFEKRVAHSQNSKNRIQSSFQLC